MKPKTVYEVIDIVANEINGRKAGRDASMEVWREVNKCVNQIYALKSTLPDLPILQEGMVAVPEEPTKEILKEIIEISNNGMRTPEGDYRALLSVAKEEK